MTSTQALQPTHPAIEWLLGPFSKAQNGWGMKPTTFPNLAPRCRLHEAIPLPPKSLGSVLNLAQNNFTITYFLPQQPVCYAAVNRRNIMNIET